MLVHRWNTSANPVLAGTASEYKEREADEEASRCSEPEAGGGMGGDNSYAYSPADGSSSFWNQAEPT